MNYARLNYQHRRSFTWFVRFVVQVMILDVDSGADGKDGCTMARLNYGAFVNEVGFSPDGKRIAAAGYANHVKIWDAVKLTDSADWRFSEMFILRHDGPVMSLVFHPEGIMVGLFAKNEPLPRTLNRS